MPGMAGDRMQIESIGLEKIRPNAYNPNVLPEDVLVKLRAEITQKGLCEPIIVRGGPEVYEIVDGYHRWLICRDLGLKEIPCVVRDYNDTEAKIKTLQLNYMRGSAVPVKLAHLIYDLNKEVSLPELAKRLPYEEPQMLDTLEFLKLPQGFGEELEAQALREQEELPSVMSFVLYKSQVEAVERAIGIASRTLPGGAKNSKALALETICANFIETHVVGDSEAVSGA